MARYRHVLIGFKSFKRCTLTSLYIEVEFWSGESRGAAHWRCCIPKYVCWIQLYSQGRRVMTVGHVWIFLQQCLRGTLAHFIVCWNWKTLPLSSHVLMKCELIRQKEIFDFLMPEWTLSLPLSIMHVVCSNYLFMYEECVRLQIGYNQSRSHFSAAAVCLFSLTPVFFTQL